jgi:hypothetical protein
MAPNVITFVITIPVYGQCLETIKFAIPYCVFQGSHRSAASDHYERTDLKRAQSLAEEYEEGSKTKGTLKRQRLVSSYDEASEQKILRRWRMNCCRRQKIDWADPAAEQGGSRPRISKFFLSLKEFRLGGHRHTRVTRLEASLTRPCRLRTIEGRVDHGDLPPPAPLALGNDGNGREGPVCRLPYSPINSFERRECRKNQKLQLVHPSRWA